MKFVILIQVKLYAKINQLLMEILSTDLTCSVNYKKLRKLLILLCDFNEMPHLLSKAFDTLLCIEIFRFFILEIDIIFNCINTLFKHKVTKLFVVSLIKVPSNIFIVMLANTFHLLQEKVRFFNCFLYSYELSAAIY